MKDPQSRQISRTVRDTEMTHRTFRDTNQWRGRRGGGGGGCAKV